jgi:hypothetical protein
MSIGLHLSGPPWQPVCRRDVALVWRDHLWDLPGTFLLIHAADSSPVSSAPLGIRQRFNFRDTLFISWDGCGITDTFSSLEAALSQL